MLYNNIHVKYMIIINENNSWQFKYLKYTKDYNLFPIISVYQIVDMIEAVKIKVLTKINLDHNITCKYMLLFIKL